ncbi:unnamed protein product, partial [Effrenium voratum]
VPKPPPRLGKSASVPSPAGPAGPRNVMPMSRRYDVSAEILSREVGKPRPGLQAVLRSMRRPIHEVHGLDAEHWYAAVERARSAERRRRGGVDKRPVPSWNFRGGGPLQPLAGTSRSQASAGPASLRWKLHEQLQRQEQLRRELQELQAENEVDDGQKLPALHDPFASPQYEEGKEMDEEEVLRQLDEQKQVQQRLHEKLQHLLSGRPLEKPHPNPQEQQLLAEHEELDKRLQQQMEEVRSQEEALRRLQEQAQELAAH